MARLNVNRLAAVGVLSFIASAAFVAACSSDTNPSPGEDGGSGATSGETGGKGNGGKGNGGSGGGAKTDGGGGDGASSNGGSGTGASGSKMDGGGPDSGAGGTGAGGDGGSVGGSGGGDAGVVCLKGADLLNASTNSKKSDWTAKLDLIGSDGKRPAPGSQ
jgi:hypothetical protein